MGNRQTSEMENFFQACGEGNFEKVKIILESNPEFIIAEANRAIRIASENGHLEIVKFLLAPEREPKVDITAINSALRWASAHGHLETVKFLHESKADITAENNLAVQVASANGHLKTVKFLLENKADITAEDNRSVRAASANGHLKTVKFLVENKAEITADNNQAIRAASQHGHYQMVKFLLENKADITANNNQALRVAEREGWSDIVDYLTYASNPLPLSPQALLLLREKCPTNKAVFDFLDLNLKTIQKKLAYDQPCILPLKLEEKVPEEQILSTAILWFKQKGAENVKIILTEEVLKIENRSA